MGNDSQKEPEVPDEPQYLANGPEEEEQKEEEKEGFLLHCLFIAYSL